MLVVFPLIFVAVTKFIYGYNFVAPLTEAVVQRCFCETLFHKKVGGLRPTTLLKKRLSYRCFPVNYAKFVRTPFFTEHLR